MQQSVISKQSKFTYFMFIVISCFSGCVANDRKEEALHTFGKEFNVKRARLTIPLIENDWDASGSDTSVSIWKKQNHTLLLNTPEHIRKIIKTKGRTIVSEEDIFNYMNDDIAYRLFIEYDYRLQTLTRVEFLVHHFKTFPPATRQSVSLQFADSVLRKWKIKEFYQGIIIKSNDIK